MSLVPANPSNYTEIDQPWYVDSLDNTYVNLLGFAVSKPIQIIGFAIARPVNRSQTVKLEYLQIYTADCIPVGGTGAPRSLPNAVAQRQGPPLAYEIVTLDQPADILEVDTFYNIKFKLSAGKGFSGMYRGNQNEMR
jgi:hypothetical protein